MNADAGQGYCIIGAGPGGLAMGQALRRERLPFTIFERHSAVGGIWDISRPTTPIYKSTHFISSRKVSGFPGFAMPDRFADYPRHDRIHEYLTAFAEDVGLMEHIQFETEVRTLRDNDGGCEVELSDGSVHSFRGAVVAVGHNWEPNLPDYPGRFSGQVMHSFDYRSSEVLRGRRILVVGGGNSGCDIACDAAVIADQTFLSLRRGYHIFPKHIAGIPSDEFAERTNRPGSGRPEDVERMLRNIVGDLRRYGLPRPSHRPFESNPIMNTQVLHHISHGDIEPVADVARLEGRTVEFVDGSRREVDIVILATGYRYGIPLLDGAGRPAAVPDLFAHIFPADRPNVFVIGLFETDGAAFPLIALQSNVVVAAIRATLTTGHQPEWFRKLIRGARPDLSGGREYVRSYRHSISVYRDRYVAFLEDLTSRLLAA